MRALLVIAHRYVGLATAAFLTVIGLTGSLLAYLHPISVWLAPELYQSPGHGVVLSPKELAARAHAAEPRAQIDGWPLKLREGEGVSFYVHARLASDGGAPTELAYDQLWLDPVTGDVLGRVDSTAFPPTRQSLMNFVYRLHYSLAIPGNWGLWIMGIVAILWFFDCFVGAWLTLPRGRPFLQKWKPAWGVKRKRLRYDLHRAGGLWPWLLLATLALSGVYFNLGRQVFLPVFDLVATRTADPFETRPVRAADDSAGKISAEHAVEITRNKAAELGWHAQPLGLYHRATQGFWQVYYEKTPEQWATAGGFGIDIDDISGEVIFVREPGGTRGDVFLAWLTDLHMGGVFGWPYRIVLCGLGLAITTLSLTGVLIWWRKRRGRRALRLRHTRSVPHIPRTVLRIKAQAARLLFRSPGDPS